MKKRFLITAIILLFLINFFEIKNFYLNVEWKNFYDKKDFLEAQKKFSKIDNIEWVYNLWNNFYNQKKFFHKL